MSTWTEVTTYIKTQLKPGVLGNTNVQKILNSIMAVINQINNGDYAPDPEALWNSATIYPADTVPVIWQDKWLVSNIADNEGNVPINTSGVVHPTWRVIGSSSGSGIQIWSAIVYPNTLEIVFNSGTLYYLDRAVVGTDPFVSSDFATELAAEQWKTLSGGSGSGLPSDVEAALLNADSPTASNFFITLSELLSYLPDQVIDEGTVTFLSSTSLQVESVVFLRGGVGYVITDETIAVTDNSETVNRVDILYAQVSETPLYTAGTEDGSQAIPTVPDDHVLIRTLFRNSNGTNTTTSPGNGGGTPNLQQVTNKGNSTSKTIQHAPATTDAQSATLGQVKAEAGATAVRDKLAGLTGEDRLDASAIKNLPGASGISHATSDGNFYASRNGAWEAFTPGIQHATSDGNFYASKDGAWASFSPFVVSGTPSDGDVVTWNSGTPIWAAPSGGGGITGSGTNSYIPKWNGSTVLNNSVLYQGGSTRMHVLGYQATTATGALSASFSVTANIGPYESTLIHAKNTVSNVDVGTGTYISFLTAELPAKSGSSYASYVNFEITRYESVSTNSRTAFRIRLTHGSGNYQEVFQLRSSGLLILPLLPTSDPLIAGGLWNDSGTPKISAG